MIECTYTIFNTLCSQSSGSLRLAHVDGVGGGIRMSLCKRGCGRLARHRCTALRQLARWLGAHLHRARADQPIAGLRVGVGVAMGLGLGLVGRHGYRCGTFAGS